MAKLGDAREHSLLVELSLSPVLQVWNQLFQYLQITVIFDFLFKYNLVNLRPAISTVILPPMVSSCLYIVSVKPTP